MGYKTAVADSKTSITYDELLNHSQRFGSWIAHRIPSRHAVVLYLEKSPMALAAMLGVVQAGCFYSVVDVRQSPQRALAMCKRLQPALILSDEENLHEAESLFSELSIPIIQLERAEDDNVDIDLLINRRSKSIDTDPLYVTFTSGSTGTPKGVVTSHRSVLDFVSTFVSTFGINEDDIMGNQAPFDFDASVKDIYSALLTGATVRLIRRDLFTTPAALMDYLCDSGATVLVWAVSAMCFVSIMNAFDYRAPSTVRLVLFSGEVMPPKQLAVWRKHLPHATYVNLYGPTESTCNCSYFIVDRDYEPNETIPAGKPFGNELMFLLDETDSEVVAPFVSGEVCVGGTTLALGYLGGEDPASGGFVQNPLNKFWPEPIYRTGDLAHYDGEGNLIYESRKDHQIKHLGQRIELGEIEAIAQSFDGVDRAICLYDSHRKKIHLAYVGSREKSSLTEALRSALPSYMVPNRTHQIASMPLNKNGKTDRAALERMFHITR